MNHCEHVEIFCRACVLCVIATIAHAAVSDDGGLTADNDGRNWPGYGRTYQETHSSPLHEIDASTIGRLGLAWSMELPNVHNGGTVPLEVDGTLYFTVDQSMVRAVDARSGKLLWLFDPAVGKVAGHKLRYSWGPRGVAYWKGRIYVGTTDGRLIAIDARSGKPVWTQMTVDAHDVRTITGAPRVFNGKVIIGHGGADFAQLRGYVTAYDAESGRQLWRFYTVPGDPKDGFESDAMKMAASTWSGETWKKGGGGTVPAGIAPPSRVTPIDDPNFVVDPAKAQRGALLFLINCGLCHGSAATAGGFAPDLRASTVPLSADTFAAIVKQGALTSRGMPIFDELTDEQLDMLRHFIRSSARDAVVP